jgi:hypothetical protein
MTSSKSFRLLEGRDIGNSFAIGEVLERYLGVVGHLPLLNSLLMDNPITRWLEVQSWNYLVGSTLRTIKDRMADEHARDDMIEHWVISSESIQTAWRRKRFKVEQQPTWEAGAGSVGTALQAFVHCIAKDCIRLKRLQVELDAATARNELGPGAAASLPESMRKLNLGRMYDRIQS